MAAHSSASLLMNPIDVIPAIEDAVTDAPLVKGQVVRQLQRQGLLDMEEGEAVRIVDDALARSQRCCVFDYRGAEVVDLCSRLVAGRVFTHRITETDLIEQGLTLGGDLDVIASMIARGALETRDVRLRHGSVAGWRGMEAGADWIAGLEVGDLVGLEAGFDGLLRLHVYAPGDLGPGYREAESLRRALDPARDAGMGVSIVGPVLAALGAEALTQEATSLFRSPVPPVSELLGDCGRHRHFFGASTGSWVAQGEHARAVIREALTPITMDSCCQDAMATVLGAWENANYVFGGPATSADPVLAALLHEEVAARFVETVAGEASPADVGLFARTLDLGRADDEALRWGLDRHGVGGHTLNPAYGGRVDSAGARLLLGVAAERNGQLGHAQVWFEGMLSGVQQAPLAVEHMAWIRYDQSDFAAAAELLGQLRGADDDAVRYAAKLAVLPLNLDLMNDCSSGGHPSRARWCAQCEPQFAPSAQAHVVWAKCVRFLATDPELARGAQRVLQVAGAGQQPYSRPFVSDLLLFELGFGQRYVGLRGQLLPVAERRMLIDWMDAPLRALELVDDGQWLRDGVTGERFAVGHDTFGSLSNPPTTRHFVGRVLSSAGRGKTPMVVGSPLALSPLRWDEVRRILDGDPSVHAVLAWHLQTTPDLAKTVGNDDR